MDCSLLTKVVRGTLYLAHLSHITYYTNVREKYKLKSKYKFTIKFLVANT